MKAIPLSSGKTNNRSSGIRGVTWHGRSKKWVARHGYSTGGVKKRKQLGYFDTIEEAKAALDAYRGVIEPKGFTEVSDEDYEYLAQFQWHRTSNGYVVRNAKDGAKWVVWLMHREIADRMGLAGDTVDHKDGNPLNNQRSNLRAASQSQQNFNQRRRADNASGVRGVCWDASREKWYARITVNGAVVWSGRFDTLEEAGAQREFRLQECQGEFARCSTEERP